MARANKFESGIFNYCDRWCEKCHKAKKCFLFYKEQKNREELIEKGIDPDDPKNIFLIVEKSFKETEDLLNKFIKENKIDLSKLDDNQDEYELIEKATKRDKLYKLSNKFIKKLGEYFETTPSLDIEEYRESFENLSHHGFFLGPKIYRSVFGVYESRYEKGDNKAFSLKDSEKCAMVTLRSVLISKKSLELMDTYVVDCRLQEMIELLNDIIENINILLEKCQNETAVSK